MPIWQWKSNNKQKIDNKRTILINKINTTKTEYILTTLELEGYVERNKSKLSPEKIKYYKETIEALKQIDDDLNLLKNEIIDYKKTISLQEIESFLANLDSLETSYKNLKVTIEHAKNHYNM